MTPSVPSDAVCPPVTCTVRPTAAGVAGTAVCLRPAGGELISLGVVAGPPTLMADGGVSIVYTSE